MYGELNSYEILDFDHYLSTHGTARVLQTRDLMLHPTVFPFRALGKQQVRSWNSLRQGGRIKGDT